MLMPAPEGIWARSKREIQEDRFVRVVEEPQILRKILAFNQHGYPLVLTPGGELVTPWSVKGEKFVDVYRFSPIEDKCPSCGKASILVKELDRFTHEDGSENRPCWVAMTRGNLNQ